MLRGCADLLFVALRFERVTSNLFFFLGLSILLSTIFSALSANASVGVEALVRSGQLQSIPHRIRSRRSQLGALDRADENG
jgi:hypothetical protein